MKIRKKPVVVDAWIIDTAELQFHGDVLDWVHEEYAKNNSRLAVASDGEKMVLRIRTLEGVMTAREGDVLVKGVEGELYAIKWEIFLKTYEIVDEGGKTGQEKLQDFEYDTGRPFPPVTTSRSITVDSIDDQPDGSAIVHVDMDYDTMRLFAKRGLYAALKEAAEKIVEEHSDA